MAGTMEGGRKAAETFRKRLGDKKYKERVKQRGSKGGKRSSNSEWYKTEEGRAHSRRLAKMQEERAVRQYESLED